METKPPSFSRFLYCDTNILSHLAKNPSLWPRFSSYLFEHDLTLAIGSQVAELADASRLHASLVSMLVGLPSALIKTWDAVLAEEVAAHPGTRQDSLLLYPLNALLLEENGLQNLQAWLSSEALKNARQDQRSHADQLAARHAELKGNFPPAKSGKYERSQAKLFIFGQVLQWLSHSHLDFLRQFSTKASDLDDRTFKSIRIFALVLFYKYYLGGREVRKSSDFGDLSHLYGIPYCVAAITERDMANTLRQIKRHDDVLGNTEIFDIDFFDAWVDPQTTD